MSEGDGQQRHGRRSTRRRATLGGITLAVLAVLGLGIVYGPRVVSGNYHRAAIERLASGAVGRPVTIAGPIMLSLVPDPQLRAEDVTIGGPHGARITATTLKLDLAPWPLLLGRLRATRLTLNKPDITLPWPLPGGVSAIAPPPWLASLHATINDGTFRLGPLRIDHADLSIFTGGPRSVIAASGPVTIDGVAASATLNIADTGSNGPAPVVASIKFRTEGTAKLDFQGTLDHASMLDGRLTGTIDRKAATTLAPKGTKAEASTVTGRLTATGTLVTWRNITASGGDDRRFTGDAALVLAPAPLLRLEGSGRNLALDNLLGLITRMKQAVPFAASIDLDGTSADNASVPTAHAVLLADSTSLRVQTLEAMLPGKAKLSFAGTLAAPLHGTFSLAAPTPGATLAALRSAHIVLPAWPAGFGPLDVSGRIALHQSGAIGLDELRGTVTAGPSASDFTGALRIIPAKDHAQIAARLDFTSLTLDSRTLAALGSAVSSGKPSLTGPVSLTAHEFVLQDGKNRKALPRLDARNLLIDAALLDSTSGGSVAVRLASLDVGRALLTGHGTWSTDGGVDAARISFTGPDARNAFRALAGAFGIKTRWTELPAFHQHFTAALAASGQATKLHTGLTLHLGDLHVAVTPTVDLKTGSAAGALTLHAPNAVTLIRSLGGAAILGARDGLGWPGPGSASLRASAFLAGDRIGLSDFVASFGALTAAGRLDLDMSQGPPRISGRIAADTLALPAPSDLVSLAHVALGSGFRIDLPHVSANRIDRTGAVVATDATFSLKLDKARLAPSVTLDVDHVAVASGTLKGSAVLTAAAATAPPTISLHGHLTGASATDIATMASDLGLDLPLTAGTLDLGTNLTASGADPHTWGDNLSGSLTASGRQITITGIDLGKAGKALAAAIAAEHPIGQIETADALRTALHEGNTEFDLLDLTASIAKGDISIDHAALTGPDGALDASGKINRGRRSVDLTVTTRPTVTGHKTSPALSIALSGEMAHPAMRTNVSPAISWINDHKPKSPAQAPASGKSKPAGT